jgi:DNA-binding NtrC family response regulator
MASGDAIWEQALQDAGLVGRCPAYRELIGSMSVIAASVAPVLIEGETGSGKEVAARLIHYGGPRRAGPFVPINCGALPDTLLESELFGVERGAYTDAHRSRRGLVAEASGGTLFLDEIDALSARAQVALLRFLQDHSFRPVGQAQERRADVRILAATNQSLDGLVEQGCFRADLMYRLKILHLRLPPLRERVDDIPLLARDVVQRLAKRYAAPIKEIDAQALAWMKTYAWPGNVRELENWIHRRFLMSTGDCIKGADQSPTPVETPGVHLPPFREAKEAAVKAFEREYLVRVLHEAGGNVSRAARLAGKERRAFGKLLVKHGIQATSLGP